MSDRGELPGARWMMADEVRALFPGAWWHEVLGNIASRREEHDLDPASAWVQFVEGDVAIDGSFVAGDEMWAVVVHGDLRATGDLDFSTTDYETSLLVVRGSVHARNFQFSNGATCDIAHDLVVQDLVLGRYGDESASLGVGGALRARVLVLDHVTGCSAGTFEAIVKSHAGWGLPQDIRDDAAAFDPTVLDDDQVDEHLLWTRATSGEPILRADAEPLLRGDVEARLRRDTR